MTKLTVTDVSRDQATKAVEAEGGEALENFRDNGQWVGTVIVNGMGREIGYIGVNDDCETYIELDLDFFEGAAVARIIEGVN